VAFARTGLPRTAEAIAAGELRAAIVRGDLAPGTKIRQEATAQQLGMSLIPVREALKTLAGEGALTYLPQRGYFVPELPGGAIAQMYEARGVLEAATERAALPNLREDDIASMREHLHAQRRAAEDRDAVAMIAANRGFHFAVFDRCENPWLVRFTAQLWDAVDPYRVLSYRRMWLDADEQLIPQEILVEHERILDALAAGEGGLALSLLAAHRGRSRTFLDALGPAAAGGAR
jgi:DNA-binding GntR family transcriptional regulator